MKFKIYIIVIAAFILAGCSSSEKNNFSFFNTEKPNNVSESFEDDDFDLLEEEITDKMLEVADPLEPVNRFMYHFNDRLFFWVIKPIGGTVKKVVPEPARFGIRNFFNNVSTPVRLVNCLLQGKGKDADTEFRRFVINTTEGILGFGDPGREKYGLEPVKEDLGQTLAVHGVKDGFYIVLPLLGPCTLRDAAGRFGDIFLNPIFYVEPTEAAIAISGTRAVNASSFYIGEYETFKDAAIDPYLAMRQAYLQFRKKQIQE